MFTFLKRSHHLREHLFEFIIPNIARVWYGTIMTGWWQALVPPYYSQTLQTRHLRYDISSSVQFVIWWNTPWSSQSMLLDNPRSFSATHVQHLALQVMGSLVVNVMTVHNILGEETQLCHITKMRCPFPPCFCLLGSAMMENIYLNRRLQWRWGHSNPFLCYPGPYNYMDIVSLQTLFAIRIFVFWGLFR